MVNFAASCHSEDTVGDAPYVDLINEARQLLAEGTIREPRQSEVEEWIGESAECANPKWIESY